MSSFFASYPPCTRQQLTALTEDGWSLAIHCFLPTNVSYREPVMLVHGVAANAQTFLLDPRHALAYAVVACGFPVYVVELRGAGASQPPTGQLDRFQPWGFVDHIERDMPVLIATILEHAQASRMHGIGHSMGGMLLYAMATRSQQEWASLSTLGTPMMHSLQLASRERWLLQLATALNPSLPLQPTPQRRLPLRRLIGTAGRFVPLTARLTDAILLNAANCEPEVVAKMATEGLEDIPMQLLNDLTGQMGDTNASGLFGYEYDLDRIQVPVLIIAGVLDKIALPASVEAALPCLKSRDVWYRAFGKRFGDRADYGHVDLLVGRYAADEIYPYVLDFLQEIGR